MGRVQKRQASLTIPRPFRFHSTLKRPTDNAPENSPYKPLAVLLKEVENATPERFKRQPVNRRLDYVKKELTQPQSPQLKTKTRVKPTVVAVESEEKHEFKANPVNRKILENAPAIKKTAAKKVTVPKTPKITKPKRIVKEPSPVAVKFKANPVRRLPRFQVTYQHQHTEPSEFKLPGDEISQKKKEQFKRQIDELFDELETYRNFHAQPLPDSSPDSLPAVAQKPPTKPVPFNLETELRGQMYQEFFEEKLSLEEQELEQRKAFKAQPLPSAAPFIPKKSTKKPTEPEPILLQTDIRGEERRMFDEERKRKMELEEELHRQREQERLEEEEREVKQLRKRLVHRAQPIRDYPLLRLKPSTRKLTEPRSPFIGRKRRMQKYSKYIQDQLAEAEQSD